MEKQQQQQPHSKQQLVIEIVEFTKTRDEKLLWKWKSCLFVCL